MYLGNDLSRGQSTLYYFDASGNETAITTATRPAVNISYTVGWVAVYLNGVRLHDTDYQAITGNSITNLSPALVSGDVVIIEAAHVFSVANTVAATGGTFSGAITWPSGGSANANTAYAYSQVTHLPLAGGTMSAGADISTSTTGKVKQKGAFMQSSTHQALTLGY